MNKIQVTIDLVKADIEKYKKMIEAKNLKKSIQRFIKQLIKAY